MKQKNLDTYNYCNNNLKTNIMTNSKKVQILSNNNYHLNQFTEAMFGEKTYHLNNDEDGWSMGSIKKRNNAIITQTELDMVNTESEIINLIKNK